MRQTQHDLLVADLKMPIADGLSMIREAKRYSRTCPSIIITGYSTESAAIEAVNLGVTGYLTKPFRVPQVLAAAASRARRVTLASAVFSGAATVAPDSARPARHRQPLSIPHAQEVFLQHDPARN